MTLYSKNGSYPHPSKDDTEGWIEVPAPPVPGLGQEVVWWYPPGWVVRPVQPAEMAGGEWSWQQTEGRWIWYAHPAVAAPEAILQDADTSSLARPD